MSSAAIPVAPSNGSSLAGPPRDIMIAGEPMVRVPAWVVDLDSFRRWSLTNEFPDRGRIEYFQGTVWVDMTMEEIYSHNQIKQLLNLVIGGWVQQHDLGRYYPDGARLIHDEAELSCEPDAMFASWATLQSGRLRDSATTDAGIIELVGTPDVAVEVVSKSSTQRDNVRRRAAFWRAGVAEYWIIDARKDRLSFEIQRHESTGFEVVPNMSGWVRSPVFGKELSFRREFDRLGKPKYLLDIR